MMQDWNAYRDSLLANVGTFAALNPGAVQGVMKVNDAAAESGHLEPKMHELIALAVAVTTRCDGCIAVHAKNAAECGASRDEIAEALGVAVALNAGAAMVYSARVMEALSQLPDAQSQECA